MLVVVAVGGTFALVFRPNGSQAREANAVRADVTATTTLPAPTTTTTVPPTTTTTLVGNPYANPIPEFFSSGPTDRPRVAITIDDVFGPGQAQQLAQVLDIAKARNVHLTFFPTGGAVESHIGAGLQEVWHRAVLEGHEIGNHTYTHTQVTKLTDDQVRDEITGTQELMTAALGPAFDYRERLFRPPGGAGGAGGGDPRIMAVLRGLGYSMAMWSIDSNYTSGFQSMVDKAVSQARNGSIILLHFATFSPENVASLIDRLRDERNLEPVTVSQLFAAS